MLAEIRRNFSDCLRELDYFKLPVPIPIYTEELRTMEEAIQQALIKQGLSVVVTTARARQGDSRIPGGILFKDIYVAAHVLENPKTNLKSGVGASDVAEAIAWFGKGFKPLGKSALNLEEITLGEHPTTLLYHVVFTLVASIDAPPVRPPAPPWPPAKTP